MNPATTRTVQDIPEQFRSLFSTYPQFNKVQSAVFPDLMLSNDSVVVTAPTGSGKTVLFELAIVHLMTHSNISTMKAVYVAPVKALCSERFSDWSRRFEPLGVSCIEVTGDSLEEINLHNYQLILTTPEKWDSLTRRWRDNVSFVKMVKLMMIDEVHLLSDEKRGPILESIVCRMKTLKTPIRFIAVSATVCNLEDLAHWLGSAGTAARMHKFGNEMRPVVLNRIVKNYPLYKKQSPYMFDIQLSYKLKPILLEYGEGKPALIFCSTRRGVVQTCQTLVQQLQFEFTAEQKTVLEQIAFRISDNKLKDFVRNGTGFHHAGMSPDDRNLIQEAFTQGSLPVLVATTTLAMGVNLPAHLVVIKSTHQYVAGRFSEYPESYILQMVGRAGRPQFDTHATAVIMTRNEMAKKYETLLDCKEILESSLHQSLAEHLNSEIVLYTITDLGVAMDWLRCTFLYQRAVQNPKHYGLSFNNINKELEMMVLREMNALQKAELVELVNGMDVSPTTNGRLMSHYYLNLKTFEIFKEIGERTTMKEILMLLSAAHEFEEIQLRVTEKKLLNELNASKHSETIRYAMAGKIKTKDMKINCLAQACLGCLPIPDPALQQESLRIINIMERITKCLIEYLSKKSYYLPFFNAVLLGKCLHAKLWENSVFVVRQLDRIGAALGACLVSFGKSRFDTLIQSHPCELERIVNRGPSFGNNLIDQARRLPRYNLSVRIERDSVLSCAVVVDVDISNSQEVSERSTAGKHHAVMILIGDTNNRLIHQRRVPDSTILRGGFSFSAFISAPLPKKVFVKVISNQWVGIDVDYEVVINPMAKNQLEDDNFVTKITRKRTKKVDPIALSPKVLDVLEERENIVSCFDLEPDWQEYNYEPTDLVNDFKENVEPWRVTEIVEPFNSEPISFQLFDSDEFSGVESSIQPSLDASIKIAEEQLTNQVKPKYYPSDAHYSEENRQLKRFGSVQAVAKPLKKLKSLKDFYPVVKAVCNLTNSSNDEKCF